MPAGDQCGICRQIIRPGREDEIAGNYHQLCCDLYAMVIDVLRNECGSRCMDDTDDSDATADALVRQLLRSPKSFIKLLERAESGR